MRSKASKHPADRLIQIRPLLLLLAAVLFAYSFSGCSMIRFLLEPLPPPPTLPSIVFDPTPTPSATTSSVVTTKPASASTTVTTASTQAGTPSSQTGSTAAAGTGGTAIPTQASDPFQVKVTALIIQGLNAVSREIVLDEALAGMKIPESEADQTIEKVFDLFQAVYYSHPEYYFLNGQANAGYVLLHGATTTLKSITLKPGFIDSAAGLSTAEIRTRQQAMLQAADVIAANARKQGTSAVNQLQSVHDQIIRTVQYDLKAAEVSTLNRERSHAASALLDHLALCQGYASAFQLVAQRLGYTVLMPTGTAEGVNHAWNLVLLDGRYYHLDLTYDDPTPDGGADAPVDHVHFLRSDTVMRESHVWIATDYPTAGDDGAFFYRQNGLISANRTDLQSRINKFVAGLPKSIVEPRQMEVLYTGKDLPTLANLEKMLQEALVRANRTGQILYKRRVDKSVVLIEFLPT